jgi:hypothetical protein
MLEYDRLLVRVLFQIWKNAENEVSNSLYGVEVNYLVSRKLELIK